MLCQGNEDGTDSNSQMRFTAEMLAASVYCLDLGREESAIIINV